MFEQEISPIAMEDSINEPKRLMHQVHQAKLLPYTSFSFMNFMAAVNKLVFKRELLFAITVEGGPRK
jgi:hypothetical protein